MYTSAAVRTRASFIWERRVVMMPYSGDIETRDAPRGGR